MVLAAGSVFSAVALVNELALGDRPAIASRFGPTDPALEPPPCNGTLTAGQTARLDLRLDGSIDDRRTGQVVIGGIRDGARRALERVRRHAPAGRPGRRRADRRATPGMRQPGSGWTAAPLAAVADRDLDVPLVEEALTPANRSVAEDHGLSYIEGARARHCRVTLDGDTLRRALPEVDLLIGETDISRWRVRPRLLGVRRRPARPGRRAGDRVPRGPSQPDALLAAIRFRLTAIDRGLPVTVFPPVQ